MNVIALPTLTALIFSLLQLPMISLLQLKSKHKNRNNKSLMSRYKRI